MKTAKNVWRFHTVKSGMRVLFRCCFSLSILLRVLNFYWRVIPKCLKRFVDTEINPNYEQVFLETEKDSGSTMLCIKFSKRKIKTRKERRNKLTAK